MDQKILQNLSSSERLEVLTASADKVEMFSYTRPFSPEEIREFKDEYSTQMIELSQEEDEFDKIKEVYKAKVKPMKENSKVLLTNIKMKAEFIKDKCFAMIEGNEVGYYNGDGVLVYQRPVLPGEQKTVFSIQRTGTEG